MQALYMLYRCEINDINRAEKLYKCFVKWKYKDRLNIEDIGIVKVLFLFYNCKVMYACLGNGLSLYFVL